MAEPWKNSVTPRYVADLAAAVGQSFPTFDAASFQAMAVDAAWERRELMARLRHIAHALREVLPADYAVAVNMLRDAAPRLDGYGLQNLVFPEFVGAYGLEDWEASIQAIEQFTQQTTGEFAVRPFILADQPRMLAQMLAWTRHESHHVRRLASEGSRPRLPWGAALKSLQADPAPLLPILEALKLDESDYVRKSVANNLNEIAKDHPELAIDILRTWQAGENPRIRWIIRHALRTLVKRGHLGALELLGYASTSDIEVSRLSIEPDVAPWGGTVRFSFDVSHRGSTPTNLIIDFVMYLKRPNCRRTAKVFKLTQRTIKPGQVLVVEKEYSFQAVSSRRYYAGEHAIAIKINGREYGPTSFVLAEEGVM